MKRPINDSANAHFFDPNAASHAEDKQYLLSSKGQRSDIPLPKTCFNGNGADDEIRIQCIKDEFIGYTDYLQNWSCSMWMKAPNTITNSLSTFMSEYNIIYWNGSTFQYKMYNGGGWHEWAISLQPDIWTHFVLVLKPIVGTIMNIKIYLNGILDLDEDLDITGIVLPRQKAFVQTNFITFFNVGGQTRFWGGKLSNIKFYWSKELTVQEVLADFNKENVAGLSFWIQGEEGTGNTPYDASGLNKLIYSGNGTTEILGDLTNFWYQGVDVPFSYANKVGYNYSSLFNGVSSYVDLQNIGNYVSKDIAFTLLLNFKTGSDIVSNLYLAHLNVSGSDAFTIQITGSAVSISRYNGSFFASFKSSIITINTDYLLELEWDGGGDSGVWTKKELNGLNMPNVGASFAGVVGSVIGANGNKASNFYNGDIYSLEIINKGKWQAKNNWKDEIGSVNGIPVDTTGIIPAITPTTDTLGNPLTNPGEVRQLAKVIDVNVGITTDLDYIDFGNKPSLEMVGGFIVSGWVQNNNNNTFEGVLNWQGVDSSLSALSGFFLIFQASIQKWRFGIKTENSSGSDLQEDLDINIGDNIYYVLYRENSNSPVKLWKSINGVEKIITFNLIIGDITYTDVNRRTLIGATWDSFVAQRQGNGILNTCIAAPYSAEALQNIKDKVIPSTAIWAVGFNEGQGDTVKDLIGENDGTWIGHTDPNQWGKSDDAIDYNLIETGLRGGVSSKINFNPFNALGEAVPVAYEPEGLIPSEANMYSNTTFIPSPTFGTEADSAITNMEVKEPYERQFVAEFVEELRAMSAYDLIDEQMLLGLRHGAGLRMMKGSVVPVNYGAVYIEGVGYKFISVNKNYIDTNFNPSILTTNYSELNALFGVYVNISYNTLVHNSLISALGPATSEISHEPQYSRTSLLAHSTTPWILFNDENIAKKLLIGGRLSDTHIITSVNGSYATNSFDYIDYINESFNLGRRSSDIRYSDVELCSAVFGAGIGFPYLDYYNALTKVQTKIELGNQIKDILIYNNELKTADDVRRLYAFINEPLGIMHGMEDYEAAATDKLIRQLKGTE